MAPELDRMMQQHKDAIADIERACERQLQIKLEEAASETERLLQVLRTRMIAEREDALESERRQSAQRIQDILTKSDELLAEQRSRFLEELDRQRQSLSSQYSQQMDSSGNSTRVMEDRIRLLKEEHAADLATIQLRNESQISLIQSQRESDR